MVCILLNLLDFTSWATISYVELHIKIVMRSNLCGVIGSKAFVDDISQRFKHHFVSRKEKRPKTIKGLWRVCIR